MQANTVPIPSDLLGYRDAAEDCGRPYGTVKSWANAGKIARWYMRDTDGRVRPKVSRAEVRAKAGLQSSQQTQATQLRLVRPDSPAELRQEIRRIVADELQALLDILKG